MGWKNFWSNLFWYDFFSNKGQITLLNDVTGKKTWKEDKGSLQLLKDLSRWKTPLNSYRPLGGLSRSPFSVTSLTVHSAWTLWSKIKFQSILRYCTYNRKFRVRNCNFHMLLPIQKIFVRHRFKICARKPTLLQK